MLSILLTHLQKTRNEIVIWDRIIQKSDKQKKISISRLRNKYAANDYHDLIQYHLGVYYKSSY